MVVSLSTLLDDYVCVREREREGKREAADGKFAWSVLLWPSLPGSADLQCNHAPTWHYSSIGYWALETPKLTRLYCKEFISANMPDCICAYLFMCFLYMVFVDRIWAGQLRSLGCLVVHLYLSSFIHLRSVWLRDKVE